MVEKMRRDFLLHVDEGGDALFVVNGDGRITFWSKGAARVLGRASDDVLDRPCWEILRGQGEEGEAVCKPDCPAIVGNGQQSSISYMQVVTPDNERRWMSVSHVCATDLVASDSGVAKSKVVVHLLKDATAEQRLALFGRKVLELASDVAEEPDDRQPRTGSKCIRLSPRQRRVLELMAEGLTTEAAAKQMGVQPSTVRTHVEALLRSLGVHSRLQAVHRARTMGLLR